MIPFCVTLNEMQLKKLENFKEYLVREVIPADYENEDVSVASPFVFEILATGIGDRILVKSFGKSCNLTIDDDGKIINNDTWLLEEFYEKNGCEGYVLFEEEVK